MGTADIIPGVSGGTIALILGIYRELVETIRGLSPRLLVLLVGWLRSGRSNSHWDAVVHEWERLNTTFLFTLGFGIVTAIGIGSMTIPTLLERYPEAMRALFFGLILASVFVPFRMIDLDSMGARATVALTVTVGGLLGFALTDPSHVFEPSQEWVEVEAKAGETLKDITRRSPSSMPTHQVYWSSQNVELRERLSEVNPETARELAGDGVDSNAVVNKNAAKAKAEPYDAIEIPEGTPVKIPRPTLWFIFLAGLIAICAMILPGISGSYILLILGAYFFILNALKGFISSVLAFTFPGTQVLFVGVFCAGCAIGILGFARILSFLLARYTAGTLGVLVGLMVGCLRGIWPFRQMEGSVEANVLPAAFDATVISALIAALAGFVVVAVMTYVGSRSRGSSKFQD